MVATGGVGSALVQLASVFGASTIIAVDISDDKLTAASKLGATHTVNSAQVDAAEAIREITGGLGVQAVFDFVGAGPTMATAVAVAAADADVTIVGIGGGTVELGFGAIAYDVAVRIPYWGSRSELIEVLDLARGALEGLGDGERDAVLAGTARRFYRLDGAAR